MARSVSGFEKWNKTNTKSEKGTDMKTKRATRGGSGAVKEPPRRGGDGYRPATATAVQPATSTPRPARTRRPPGRSSRRLPRSVLRKPATVTAARPLTPRKHPAAPKCTTTPEAGAGWAERAARPVRPDGYLAPRRRRQRTGPPRVDEVPAPEAARRVSRCLPCCARCRSTSRLRRSPQQAGAGTLAGTLEVAPRRSPGL